METVNLWGLSFGVVFSQSVPVSSVLSSALFPKHWDVVTQVLSYKVVSGCVGSTPPHLGPGRVPLIPHDTCFLWSLIARAHRGSVTQSSVDNLAGSSIILFIFPKMHAWNLPCLTLTVSCWGGSLQLYGRCVLSENRDLIGNTVE